MFLRDRACRSATYAWIPIEHPMDFDDDADPWGDSRPSQIPSSTPPLPQPASLNVTVTPELRARSSEYLPFGEDSPSPSQHPARLTRDTAFSSATEGNGNGPGETVKMASPRSSPDLTTRFSTNSDVESEIGGSQSYRGSGENQGRALVPDPEDLDASNAVRSRRAVPGVYRGPRNPDNRDNYDPHTAEFAQESTGRRVAYENFTTIDWIHVRFAATTAKM